MVKRLLVKLTGNRGVIGRLSGIDVFMNLTLEDAEEVVTDTQTRPVGMIVIRGSSVIEMGVLDQA